MNYAFKQRRLSNCKSLFLKNTTFGLFSENFSLYESSFELDNHNKFI